MGWYSGNALDSHLGGAWFKSQMGHWLSCLRLLHDYPQSLQANARIVPQFGHNGFLPNPFHFIILSFNTTQSSYHQ
jgi:hypothetical protein